MRLDPPRFDPALERPSTSFDRRQLLQALGLGALASVLPRASRARAAEPGPPSRIVFFIQPHAHVPRSWMMPLPDGPAQGLAERTLLGLTADEFSPTLRPLHAFRDRLLVVEGLSHMAVLADLTQIDKHGGDPNNHNVAVAGLLTGVRALQRPDIPCTGGGRSIDQELARRVAVPGRFASRVYGATYVPNAEVAPFSFLDAGVPTPIVTDPTTAFADLMGLAGAPSLSGPPTRADKLRAMRGSVLDTVAAEYEALAPRVGAAERQKLDAHRGLVRELELSLDTSTKAACALSFDGSGDSVTPFMRLIRMALACDLTRVITYVAPVPQCPEFGYPAEATVHGTYAHAAVPGLGSCGQSYSPTAEQAMNSLSVWYANHFAELLRELDAVSEGSGTLLDHTTVVWISELGSPAHQHDEVFTLLAGGGSGFFRSGRYVRYPRTLVNPRKVAMAPGQPTAQLAGAPLGPAHSRLFVSLLEAMGQSDPWFGQESVLGNDGTTLSLRGALRELHR
ncbi:MAG: hypothetical protein RLZZ450_1232 [Pseudomonadota bacterium]|jgi:hypothetical protein